MPCKSTGVHPLPPLPFGSSLEGGMTDAAGRLINSVPVSSSQRNVAISVLTDAGIKRKNNIYKHWKFFFSAPN